MQVKHIQIGLAAILLATLTSMAGVEIIFKPPVHYSLGSNPTGLTAGDFNNDGLPDLAMITSDPSAVSFLYNSPRGFIDGGVFPLAKDATGGKLLAADMNDDDLTDLVLLLPHAQVVMIMSNLGRRGFVSTAVAPTGVDPHGMVLGDVDNNGRLDVIVANTGSDSVSILLNLGWPRSAVMMLKTGHGPRHVALGDLDVHKNRGIDLVVTNTDDGTISVFRNAGFGSFAQSELLETGPSTPDGLALGDWNRDGAMDIAAAAQGRGDTANGIMVYLNNQGAFSRRAMFETLGRGTVGLAAADIDGDGVADLITTDRATNTVSILCGRGNGTFQLDGFITVGDGPDEVLALDLDQDGDIDLVTMNAEGKGVTVLYNWRIAD
jgi:hypothetical protein